MVEVTDIRGRIDGSAIGKRFSDRFAWVHSGLISTGKRGVTPIGRPSSPGWSRCAYRLRRAGAPAKTLPAKQGGAFPGRGVLEAAVTVDAASQVKDRAV